MAKGGRRPGAGRKKGGGNRWNKTAKDRVAEILAKADELPLEFLLKLMRAPEPVRRDGELVSAFLIRYQRWAEERFEAAKAAAPFCHPKLAAIEWRPPGSLTKDHARASWDTLTLAQRLELRDKIKALIDSYVRQPLPLNAEHGGPQPQ